MITFSELVVVNLIANGGTLAYSYIDEALSVSRTEEAQVLLNVCKKFKDTGINYKRSDIINWINNSNVDKDTYNTLCGAEYVIDWESYPEHINNLKRKRRKDTLISEVIESANHLVNDSLPLDDVLDLVQSAIDAYRIDSVEDESWLGDLMVRRAQELKALKDLGVEHTGISCGIPELDNLISYAQAGNLIIIAARPGCGKTSLLMTILEKMSSLVINPEKEFIYVVEGEMIANEIVDKEHSLVHNINSLKFRYPTELSDELLERLAILNINKNSVAITTKLHTPEVLTQKIKALEFKTGKKCITVLYDYLQLLSSETDELAKFSKEFKNGAKSIKCPIWLISQLNTAADTKAMAARNKFSEDAKPTLGNLSKSAAQISADADVVLFMYKPGMYDFSITKKYVELILGKGRFVPETTLYCRVSDYQEIEPISFRDREILLSGGSK